MSAASNVSYYDFDQMHESERDEFLFWYETTTDNEVSDNNRMLERECQAYVTVLRVACRTVSRHFPQIVNVELFLESMIIHSGCNKAFRKCFFCRKG